MSHFSINGDYDSEIWWKTFLPRYKYSLSLISPYIKLKRSLKILDFGTGPGYMSILIKRNFPQHEIVAGDVSISTKTKEKLIEAGIGVKEGLKLEPSGRLPLETDFFDVVLFFEVLEHIIDDPRHVISEICRILKSGGYLFLTTPNMAWLYNRIMLLIGKQPQPYVSSYRFGYTEEIGHFREYTATELRFLLQNSFRVEKCDYVDIVGTKGLVGERKLLRIAYYPYRLFCLLKPSFRSQIVMVCKKEID
jgi:SAM-dependent methyltransferase